MSWVIIVLVLLFLLYFFSKKNYSINNNKGSGQSFEKMPLLFKEWANKFDPENSSEKLTSFHTKVVGVTFKNKNGIPRQEIISDCKIGENLILMPEPDNQHDENAVKVCRANGLQIGYLNSIFAYEVKQIMEKYNSRVDAIITDITGGEISGVNILIQKYKINNRPPRKKKEPVEEKPFDPNIKIEKGSFNRSMQAKDLESQGFIENAIELYESVVKSGFDAPFSYERLSIIYRKRKEYEKEIAVLDKLIKTIEKSKNETDPIIAQTKIDKVRERIQKANELKKLAENES